MLSNETALASRNMVGAHGCDGRNGNFDVVKNEYASGTHDAIAINLNMVDGVNLSVSLDPKIKDVQHHPSRSSRTTEGLKKDSLPVHTYNSIYRRSTLLTY
jgi:hypothetical protein